MRQKYTFRSIDEYNAYIKKMNRINRIDEILAVGLKVSFSLMLFLGGAGTISIGLEQMVTSYHNNIVMPQSQLIPNPNLEQEKLQSYANTQAIKHVSNCLFISSLFSMGGACACLAMHFLIRGFDEDY